MCSLLALTYKLFSYSLFLWIILSWVQVPQEHPIGQIKNIIQENSKFVLVERTFNNDLSSEELTWHRDKEDREVILKKGKGWYIQFDNRLPILMSANNVYNIPSYSWHRIINKNRTNLTIEVKKYK